MTMKVCEQKKKGIECEMPLAKLHMTGNHGKKSPNENQ